MLSHKFLSPQKLQNRRTPLARLSGPLHEFKNDRTPSSHTFKDAVVWQRDKTRINDPKQI